MQEKQSDRSQEINEQIAILRRLDNSLIKFFKSKVSYGSLSDEDQKRLKDLKKKTSDMREVVQETLDSLNSVNYSQISANSRFASKSASKRVVGSFLNLGDSHIIY